MEPLAVDLGTIITMMDKRVPEGESTHEVVAACEDKTGGHWYCVTHDEHHQNQLQKDIHCDDGGYHLLAWWCHQHGPEVP